MNFLPQTTLIARRRSLYWLLLVLAMFIGGQTLADAHWHDDAGQKTDDYCALCLLAATTGSAAISSAWQLFAASVITFYFLTLLVPAHRKAARFCDSQGPPALLNFNV